MSLSMCTVDENDGFNFGKRWKNHQIHQINSLQNYPPYGKYYRYVLVIVYNWFFQEEEESPWVAKAQNISAPKAENKKKMAQICCL